MLRGVNLLTLLDRRSIASFMNTALKQPPAQSRAPLFDLKGFLQTMITLASASLGLVAALAWNDAIKAAMTELFGERKSIPGLFAYAVTATALAVLTVVLLGRAAARVGGEAKISREAD